MRGLYLWQVILLANCREPLVAVLLAITTGFLVAAAIVFRSERITARASYA
jgi:hypothetical protein